MTQDGRQLVDINIMKRIIELLLFVGMMAIIAVMSAAIGGCDSDKTCPGCNGHGALTDGTYTVTCFYCNGEGKVSKEKYEMLTSGPDVDDEPVRTDKYCTMCMGTGKFHAPKSIFVNDCTFCHGTGVADDDRFNTTADLYVCVDCGGKGTNFYGDGQCTTCNGTGMSYLSVEQQLQQGPRSSGRQLCAACGGSEVCPVCHGHDRYMIGGEVPYCSSCGNTGRCRWCYGSGFQQ